MSGRLADKVAIVTGGASGIGAAVATRFRQAGAHVVSADIAPNAEHHLDVSDEASCAALVSQVMEAHGRIDALVNSAAVVSAAPFLETKVEDFDRILAVNLRGTFLIGQACARVMGRGASIVNFTSVLGLRGKANRGAYSASKGGIIALTRVMACELAERGIRVNAIAPGPTDTATAHAVADEATRAAYNSTVPLGRFGLPEEVAAAAEFLCSDDASYVTGHTLAVDGGLLASGLKT